MGVRRQIYIQESDDRLLEEQSKSTGLSVSELVRRAVNKCYGAGRGLTWDEFFSWKAPIGSVEDEPWIYDRLFDDEWMNEAVDALERER